MFSAEVSGAINLLVSSATTQASSSPALNLKAPQARRCTRLAQITTRHPPASQRLSWMGAMSPSNPLSGVRNLDALPARFTPPPSSSSRLSLPQIPQTAKRKQPISGRCYVLIAHLCSSLVSRQADPALIRTSARQPPWLLQRGEVVVVPAGTRRIYSMLSTRCPPATARTS